MKRKAKGKAKGKAKAKVEEDWLGDAAEDEHQLLADMA